MTDYEELVLCRESEFKPCTKFLSDKYTIGDQFNKIRSELQEAIDAFDLYKDHLEKREQTRESFNHVVEEVNDIINSCVTLLAKLGLNKKQRTYARIKVIEKNAKRGYYND